MKQLVLLLSLVLTAVTPASRALAVEDTRELKVVMEEMGGVFKTLSRSVAQRRTGAAELGAARQLVMLVEESIGLTPDLSSFPDRTAAAARYQDLMAQLLQVVKDAEAAIARADATAALVALEAAKELRTIGHDEFKF